VINSIKAQLEDWKYGRNILKSFVLELDDTDLDKILPRENLNTIRKQCEELIQIQTCYIDAMKSKSISFKLVSLTDLSKTGLKNKMEELDVKMEASLEYYTDTETINWFGEEWLINRHLSALIGHEQMHIGQIIGFCYATDIKIPKYIEDTMALSN